MEEIKYDHIVVRYGELSTKGKNKKDFTRKLTNNIKKRLENFKCLKFKTLFDGLYIELNNESFDEIKKKLKTVFGYSYFAGCLIIEKDLEKAKESCLKLIKKDNFSTFKINTKRIDKNFSIRSYEITNIIASYILKEHNIKVDVHNPDITLSVYINNNDILIMDEKVQGIGGYPVGINGKALVMTSGGIDSPVACYLTMKRGLQIECIHFASQPYTSKQAINKVHKLCNILNEYQPNIIIHIIPFTKLQLEIYKYTSESYAITIMRRMMYRIADRICKKRKMLLISNGESIGQVASQTPESISVISKVCDSLIVRPLCMLDKLEIIDIAKKIGTYETSILPYEDCCTIFGPKNPVTKPKEKECLFYESKFDYESLIEECINNDEIVSISLNETINMDIY